MKTKLIIALLLTLFIFRLPPLARAQEDDLSKEIAKTVEKVVNEKIEAMRAGLQEEIINQLQSYHLGQIESFDPETQTATVFVDRRFINGKLLHDSYACNAIPVFIPAGGNVRISRGDRCVVFFSGLDNEGNINLVSKRKIRASSTTPSEAFAIVGFFSKQDQERKANEQQMISELAARLGSINSGFAQAPSTAQTTGGIDTARFLNLVIELTSELNAGLQRKDFSMLIYNLNYINQRLKELQKQ